MKRYVHLLLFLFSVIWITLNVYLLPFHVWTAGVVYPWFMTKGLTLYKDVIWIRMPLDMFLLSGWYGLFGASGQSYQFFIWLIFVVLSLSLLVLLKQIDGSVVFPAFIFFLVMLFPLFLNVEVGELLVGFLVLLLYYCGHRYISARRLPWLLGAGLAAGLMAVTKQNTILVAFVLPLIVCYRLVARQQSLSLAIREGYIYAAGLAAPFIIFAFYFFSRGALYDFLYYSFYTVIGPYRNFTLLDRGDGLYIELAYALLLVPSIVFWKQLRVQKQTVVLIVLLVVALVPSLFPSYLSYRTFTSFALVSIAGGYALSGLCQKKQALGIRLVIVGALIGFIGLTWRYTTAYVDFIRDNGLTAGEYLRDYGDFEMKIADWIGSHTDRNDRIITYGSEMIYLLSDRLPANKYTNFTPFILQPYGETTKIFADNAPRAIVFDWAHPDLSRGLSEWPFLQYMQDHYREVMRLESLVLYQKDK